MHNKVCPQYLCNCLPPTVSRISSWGGGAHLKKLRRAEGGAKIFGVFRVKNHDFTPTNLIFSNFRGGGGGGGVSSISDHNLRNNENYTTPRNRLRMSLTSFIPSTVSL